MLNTIIIDDEKMSREILKSMINKHPELNLLNEFDSSISAFGYITKHSEEIDFIFLDIHLQEFTGFDFLNSLAAPPPVILVSSDSEKALKAFEYENIVDYLLKPVEFNRFIKAISKLQKVTGGSATANSKSDGDETKQLFINVNKRLIKINFDDIEVVEAKGDYIQIHTPEKSYIVHSTMKNVEQKLPTSMFYKVHRSYIVNLSKIVDIVDNTILIRQKVIPISQAKKSDLMTKLNRL